MLVREYMTANPVTVKADESLARVGQVFDVEKFRHLPVVDESHNIVGILSDRDLRNLQAAMEILESNISGEEQVKVRDVMTSHVTSVTPDAPLREAAQKLIDMRIGAMPVCESGSKLVGIISYTDILRAFVKTGS